MTSAFACTPLSTPGAAVRESQPTQLGVGVERAREGGRGGGSEGSGRAEDSADAPTWISFKLSDTFLPGQGDTSCQELCRLVAKICLRKQRNQPTGFLVSLPRLPPPPPRSLSLPGSRDVLVGRIETLAEGGRGNLMETSSSLAFGGRSRGDFGGD